LLCGFPFATLAAASGADPARGRLLMPDAATPAPLREVELGGAPFNVLAVAGSGERH